AARGRDDAQAGCRRLSACRTLSPRAARRRWRRGHNKDRGSPDQARGCPAEHPFPCRRRWRGNPRVQARISAPMPRSRAAEAAGCPDRAHRYPDATAAAPLAARRADRRNPRCRRPDGKSCRSETSPPAVRAEACASRRRMNCLTLSSRSWDWLSPLPPSCAGRRFRNAAAPGETTNRLCGHAAEAEREQFKRIEMHPLGQGIAHLEQADDPVCEGLNDCDLQCQPEIPDVSDERSTLVEQDFITRGQRLQAFQERRLSARLAQLLDRRAASCKRIARQVDAVEIFEVFAAVLKMIVDLQAGANGVRSSPGRGAFAMD